MTSNVEANVLSELRSTMKGTVVTPEDKVYDARKVRNGAINHHPALIAICESVAYVQLAVRAGGEYHLPLSIRDGSYGWRIWSGK